MTTPRREDWIHLVKGVASVFADSDLAQQLADLDVDSVTFAGFMTNNCILGSTVDTEGLGLSTEVLSDATGAISIANDAGSADAETVHTALMALLNSNWASVSTVEQWRDAVSAGSALEGSNLVESALTGAERAG